MVFRPDHNVDLCLLLQDHERLRGHSLTDHHNPFMRAMTGIDLLFLQYPVTFQEANILINLLRF